MHHPYLFFNVKIQYVCFFQPTAEVQQKGKSHLPPPTTTIFSSLEVINHSVRVKSKDSAAACEHSSPEKA